MSMQERITENEAYLSAHPEVKEIVAGFLLSLLKEKPHNVTEYAAKYFTTTKPSASPPVVNGNNGVITNGHRPVQAAVVVGHAPLVIVGPSGVGKGTLITRLMKEFSDHFGFSVSHTTRKPREGEQHGIHYHFTNHDEMRHGVSKGLFIEHAEVHGNIYGTSYHAVGNVQDAGKICLLDIDVQGMEAMKRTHLAPKTIFIAPPSHEELEKRLRGRGTESEESIQKRLTNARKEVEALSQPGMVHYTIVNDDLEDAYNKLKQKLTEWYPHLHQE
jgi:guanylate kinase